jgi:hypothetical protein
LELLPFFPRAAHEAKSASLDHFQTQQHPDWRANKNWDQNQLECIFHSS